MTSNLLESNDEFTFPKIVKRIFGKISTGEETFLYTLTNSNGMSVEISNYGATVRSIFVPNNNNKLIDVVIGLDKPTHYESKTMNNMYFGGICGRFCNRINEGKFKLNGKQYNLAVNDVNNNAALHGGNIGFNRKIWNVTNENIYDIKNNEFGIELSYFSKHMEENYPGNLLTKVKYLLNIDKNNLIIRYNSVSDRDTIINLTNHSYFNLNGEFNKGNIYNH
eukprot:451293_1